MKKRSLKDKVSKDIERQERAQSSYGYLILPKGVDVFSPEPTDRVVFDIMMYEVTSEKHMDRDDAEEIAIPGTLWWKHPFKTHRGIGTGNDTVVCLTSIGKKCPICEYRAKRIKEGADKEETDALRPSQRNLYVVIPIGHKKFKEVPHIFDISQYNFQKLLNDELKENPEHRAFADLEEGETLKVRFIEKVIGKGAPFPEANRIDFIERNEQYTEEILEQIPKLDECLKILSYKELEAKLMEVDEEEDAGEIKKVSSKKKEEDDDDDEPVKKPSKVSRAAKDDDDDDDEPKKPSKSKSSKDDDDDDDDEPKKPSRTISRESTKTPKKKEDDDDDDDDEPKKPSKSKGGKDMKCPHGHKFGVDAEDFDECDDCDIWKECLDTKRGR